MKILYFGNQRLDAQHLATALRTVAKNGTVSWTSSLDRAAKWLDENRDVAALVVEAQADGATGASVLKHVRGLALRPALVVIVPDGAGTRLGPLAAAADDLIDKSSARFRDLPAIITRTVARVRGTEEPPSRPTPIGTATVTTAARVAPEPESDDRADLERKLDQAAAALREAEHKHQAAMTAASEQLAERQVKYDLATAQATARWQMVDEQLRTAAIEAESVRREQAAAASELDRLKRREKELTSQLTASAASHDSLTHRLADAEAALEAARVRAAREQSAAAEQLAARQRELQSQIAAEVDERRTLEAALAQTIRARDDAEIRYAAAVADAAAQARELEAALRQSRDGHDALTHRLADTEAALEAGHARAAREQVAAAEQLAARQREHELRMAAEAEQHRRVEATLAQAVRARDEAETRRAAAMMDAAAQLRELDAALRLARDSQASTAAEVERLTARETDLSATLASVTGSHNNLERRLAATEAAFQDADTRFTSERLELARRAAAREAELDAQIRQERAARTAVEQAAADAETALRDAAQHHDAALAAAADQLTRRQADFDAARSQSAAERDQLTARLRDIEDVLEQLRASHQAATADVAALTKSEADLTSRLSDVIAELTATQGVREALERDLAEAIERATVRERELNEQLRHDRATCVRLEQALKDAGAALAETEQRRDAALADAARVLAEHQEHSARELSQTVADRNRIAKQVTEVEATLAQVRSKHQAAAAEVVRLTKQEAELTSQLAGVGTQLADVEAAREQLAFRLADADKAVEQAAAREAELVERLRQESAGRIGLEQAIAEVEAASRDAQKRHEAAIAAAAIDLTERQTRFDGALAEIALDRDRTTQRLRTAEDMLERERHDRQAADADVARLTARGADLTSHLADVQAARDAVERQLAEALKSATARQAELDAEIKRERAARTTLEQAMTDAETARRDAQQQHDKALAAAAIELAEHQARFDGDLTKGAAERDRLTARLAEVETALERARTEHRSAAADVVRLTGREAALTTQIADVEALRQSVQGELAEAVRAMADAGEQAARDRAQFANREAEFGAKLAQELAGRRELERRLADLEERNGALSVERDGLRQSLTAAQERSQHLDNDVRASRELLEQVRAQATGESRRLTTALSESERTLSEARNDFQTMLDRQSREHAAAIAAHRGEIHQLQERLKTTAGTLATTKHTLAAVQAEADKLPGLTRELVESRAEGSRLFQQAGLAMFRCTRAGALTQANRAAMTLVGRRTIDELRGTRFGTAVFEDPNGLSFLIERCLSTRTRESIETTWRRKDGGRLFVRLSAYASSLDTIEIVAEDLTRARVLQERLGQAQRMEAVGRLASEVAVTCGNLLADVHHDVQQWLASAGEGASSRQQGEHLLAELTRATGFLRQLAAYGEEQARTPAMADLNTVIRDLEPVLKRVAGDSVDVQVSDASARLNVDVGTERIERLLVNLASFGRARMPHGGQLKIELGTTVVDRHFVAKHPNVRLGPHALITVTESRHTRKTDGLLPRRDANAASRPSAEKPEQKPGMDFGTLQGLVGGCGGHLWMTVQPQGDMVAKIHLPLLTPFEQAAPRALAVRVRERALARLFHH